MHHVDDPQVLAIIRQSSTQSASINDDDLTYKRTTKTLFGSTISADIYEYTGYIPRSVSPPDNAAPVSFVYCS